MADLSTRERFMRDVGRGEEGVRDWNKWIEQLIVEPLEKTDPETVNFKVPKDAATNH